MMAEGEGDMKEADFEKTVADIKNNMLFMSFDRFLIGKMMPELVLEKVIPEEIRIEAYHVCMKQMDDVKVASVQTIQRWFGLHGISIPNREMIFRLGFALHLSVVEVEEYLKQGIGQPGFQMSDYREVIYYYGFYHGFSQGQAWEMIDRFEQMMPLEEVLIHSKYTERLWKLFTGKMDLPEDDYLKWMLQYSAHLKGYSRTVLEYLQSFRQEILEEICRYAEQRMQSLLWETHFFQWEEKKHLSPRKRAKSIPKYLSCAEEGSGKCVSDALARSILEWLEITQLSSQANEKFLMELYASAWEQDRLSGEIKKKVSHQLYFNMMDQKYLSELFTVGDQRERQMNLLRLQRYLQEESIDKKCPERLWNRAQELGYTKESRDMKDVAAWVRDACAHQSRRCRMIHRSDLLTLVFYLAQLRYLRHMEETGENYIPETGQKMLLELADATLTACNMEKFDGKHYLLDATLWQCYQKEEMYSLSDLIDALQ